VAKNNASRSPDEPLGGLDEDRKNEILPLIEHVRDRFAVPIIYVTHSAREVARLAAHVIVLNHGHVAATQAPQDVPTSAIGPA
jgi:molybdate transport system ATP-binding protein